jgi:hypothetical protein
MTTEKPASYAREDIGNAPIPPAATGCTPPFVATAMRCRPPG